MVYGFSFNSAFTARDLHKTPNCKDSTRCQVNHGACGSNSSAVQEDQMVPRWKERMGGVVIMLLGGGFTAWTWHTALTEGYYYQKASMIFPTFCFLGLGMILFPGYRTERLARGEDISTLSGTQLITPRWWVILVLALIAGFGNYVLLRTR